MLQSCFKCKKDISEVYFSLFQNVSIGIVGKDMEFVIYDDDDVAPFLEGLEERPQRKVCFNFRNKCYILFVVGLHTVT